jgi:hypothetical protein
MKMARSICAFTPMSNEYIDWLDQYLAGLKRLDMPFVMHFDRCSDATISKVCQNPACLGHTRQDDFNRDFMEGDRQGIMDIVRTLGFNWALMLDIDEVLERDAAPKLAALEASNADSAEMLYLDLGPDVHHYSEDRGSGQSGWKSRTKAFRVGDGRFTFRNPQYIYPLWPEGRDGGVVFQSDLVILHTGHLTPELRKWHRDRATRLFEGHWAPYAAFEPGQDEPVKIVAHNLWPWPQDESP